MSDSLNRGDEVWVFYPNEQALKGIIRDIPSGSDDAWVIEIVSHHQDIPGRPQYVEENQKTAFLITEGHIFYITEPVTIGKTKS